VKKPFKILFYEDGDPIDPRCIKRFVCAFPRGYKKVVRTIIENSERLDRKVFKCNVATVMISFKMTRKGVFYGVRVDERGIVNDPENVIDTCWENVGGKLQRLKRYIDENRSVERGRAVVNISSNSRKHVVEKTSELFKKLLEVPLKNGKMSPVGASKILFATLPEVALPVDTAEWKFVSGTNSYQTVLSTMIDEIEAWEEISTPIQLEALDPYPKATLPGIYNVMAMVARSLEE